MIYWAGSLLFPWCCAVPYKGPDDIGLEYLQRQFISMKSSCNIATDDWEEKACRESRGQGIKAVPLQVWPKSHVLHQRHQSRGIWVVQGQDPPDAQNPHPGSHIASFSCHRKGKRCPLTTAKLFPCHKSVLGPARHLLGCSVLHQSPEGHEPSSLPAATLPFPATFPDLSRQQ